MAAGYLDRDRSIGRRAYGDVTRDRPVGFSKTRLFLALMPATCWPPPGVWTNGELVIA
jgi:hypothetical protein